MSIELKQRVTQLNIELEKYKQMTQQGLQLSNLSKQAGHHFKPAYPVQ